MPRLARLALVVALTLVPLVVGARARPVHVELRAVDGAPLGRLTGTLDDDVVYFALADIARLVRGRVEPEPRSERTTLVVGRRSVEVQRDSAVALVNGQPVGLSAPVHVRGGRWMVPGVWLVRALPGLVGRPVEIRAVPVPARPPPPPVAPPVSAAVPTPSAPRPAAVAVRHHSYPSYTRVVLDGVAPPEAALRETRDGVIVSLGARGVAVPPTVRPVRDGLVAAVELGQFHGAPVLRVSFERAPAGRKLLRLEDPPRLVLDFYRGSGPAVASPGAPPAMPAPPSPAPAHGVRPDAGPPTPPAAASRADAARQGSARAGAVALRYRSYPTYTRVVVEGTSPFEPRLIEAGDALVVPLAGLRTVPRTRRAVRDGLIATLELEKSRGAPALRVTFERAPAGRKVFRLPDPPRLVLDFHRALPPPVGARRAELGTIVIDAGHGGRDPGAVGRGGLREKTLTLDVAGRLATLVHEELGVTVLLTRTRDEFVPLTERTAFANRHKADLFVSIHVNAAPRATATGSETYFLSSEATDNAARAAAAFENKVIALERKTRGRSHDLLRSILWDLAQSEFQQESSHLAEALQDSLERALRLVSRGVKQAPFYVLGGAAMPAVLVEIGFLSNPTEEQRLSDGGYRERIARALAAGLATYKRRHDQRNGVVAER